MFDWNGNGKHDAFDDFVTFGLVHHIIEDSKKNEQPPVQNNRRGIYRHYDHDKNCCLPRKTQKVGNHGISRNKAG